MRTLLDISNEYRATYRQGLNLKTKKASQKKFEICRELSREFGDVLQETLQEGEVLTGALFGITGIIGGAGAAYPEAKITVLNVYSEQVVVAIPTAEYPNGEVFKINFLDGYMAERNLNALLTLKSKKVA
jgi:hypothetical protein